MLLPHPLPADDAVDQGAQQSQADGLGVRGLRQQLAGGQVVLDVVVPHLRTQWQARGSDKWACEWASEGMGVVRATCGGSAEEQQRLQGRRDPPALAASRWPAVPAAPRPRRWRRSPCRAYGRSCGREKRGGGAVGTAAALRDLLDGCEPAGWRKAAGRRLTLARRPRAPRSRRRRCAGWGACGRTAAPAGMSPARAPAC